jgi:hypothetical protein
MKFDGFHSYDKHGNLKKKEKNLVGNGTLVSRTISKHATNSAIANDRKMLHFMRI